MSLDAGASRFCIALVQQTVRMMARRVPGVIASAVAGGLRPYTAAASYPGNTARLLCAAQAGFAARRAHGAPDTRGLATVSEPKLLTPGPLTTSRTVKAAMMRDMGSRDPAFLRVVDDVREGLLKIAGVPSGSGPAFTCVLMQGSGTFAVESTLGSVMPRKGGKLLIASNGAYGERMVKIASALDIPHACVRAHERGPVSNDAVLDAVARDADITHVAVVHHETTAGVLNPIASLGRGLRSLRPACVFIVDSMSAFGAYPVNMRDDCVDFLVSSSNKCIEGVPGFAYAIADREQLAACAGRARSVALDLVEQWKGLESSKQFRFTPPTHALLAFHQALEEHTAEGGAAGRLRRYQENFQVLKTGMAKLGFHLYVDEPHQGCIISTFLNPDDAAFNFEKFYRTLAGKGFVIYPGKLTKADCFRIGSIGRLYPDDMRSFLVAVEDTLRAMNVKMPVRQKRAE